MLVGMLGDGVLFLAYLAISLQLLVFECRFRSGLPASLTKLLHLFQAFIMLCGISHLAMGLTTYAGYVSPPDPSNPVPPIPTFTVFIKVLAAAVSAWAALRLRPLANSLWKQVSERIHLFSELQTQHKALEAVTAAQNAVVAHLSHEARGPLQIVQASLGFARQDAEELSASLKSAKWPKAVVARAGGAGGQGGVPSSSSSSSSAVSMGAAATAAGRPASTGAVAAAAAARAAAASPGQPAAVRRVVKGIGKDVRQAEAAAEALAQLVDTVLDLSLLEAGRMRLRPRAVSLAALLEEAAEAVAPHPGVRVVTMVQRPFGLESLAKRWGATDAPLTLQESDVVLDPSKLSLCVGWALDSAAAFTTRGFIAVTVTEGEADPDEVFPVPTQSCRPPSLRDWAARPSMTKAEACEAFARAARDSMKLLDSPGASTLSSGGHLGQEAALPPRSANIDASLNRRGASRRSSHPSNSPSHALAERSLADITAAPSFGRGARLRGGGQASAVQRATPSPVGQPRAAVRVSPGGVWKGRKAMAAGGRGSAEMDKGSAIVQFHPGDQTAQLATAMPVVRSLPAGARVPAPRVVTDSTADPLGRRSPTMGGRPRDRGIGLAAASRGPGEEPPTLEDVLLGAGDETEGLLDGPSPRHLAAASGNTGGEAASVARSRRQSRIMQRTESASREHGGGGTRLWPWSRRSGAVAPASAPSQGATPATRGRRCLIIRVVDSGSRLDSTAPSSKSPGPRTRTTSDGKSGALSPQLSVSRADDDGIDDDDDDDDDDESPTRSRGRSSSRARSRRALSPWGGEGRGSRAGTGFTPRLGSIDVAEGLADCGGQRFPLTATAMHRTSGLGLDRAHKVAALMGGVVRQIQADGPEAAATLAPLRAELRRARTKAGPDGSGGVAVFEIWIPIDVIANPSWSNELERISHSASGGFATSWPEQASRMQLTQVAMDKDVAPPIASAGDRLDAACPPPAAAGPHTQGQEAEAGGSVGPARHRPLPHRDPAGSQSFRQTKPIPGSALAEVTADDDTMDAELARRAASHASSGRLADIEEDSGSIDVRGSDRSHERFKSDDTLGRSAAGGVESAGNGLPPGPRIDTLVGVPPPMGMGSAAAPGSPGKVAWSRGTAASSTMPTEAEATSSAAAGARDEGRSALGAEVQTLSDGDKVESWLERHGVLPSLALDSASETRAPVQLDLVLSDVLMPGLDGERLCHRMAELGLPCAMVAATGTTTAETLERLPEAGFAAVLRKPYGPRQLKRVLEATSDMALAVAYLAISVQLASFEWRFRTGLPKALLTLMHWFQAFIMLCGISHFAMGLSSVAGQGNHHDPGNATSIPLFTMSIKVLAAAVSAWTALRLRPLANSLWKQVSERIHLFSELQTQHKALEAVTAAQNAVVAHLSHEARGPLQIVQASLGFARQDAEELSASLEAESRHCPTLGSAGGAAAAAAQVAAPAAARAAAASPGQPAAVRRVVKGIGKDVRQAEAAAEALAQLVDTVLDLSLLEAGRMRLRPRAVSLAALLEEAAEAVAPHPGVRVVTMVQRPFGLESLAKRWGATDAPRGLEESDVVLDPSKLSLCVGWALDSAAAFTTRGFIAVTLHINRGWNFGAVVRKGSGPDWREV
ncbi:hypothetical protein FNF31_02976 [Cafeteria roenbergensis]|uniref:histidine kinase n=1 Tax=Cafeteria roenbergensis TaxID=33653 RepID=A0A5A8DH68_CAFRO|nr:hypothetical protein FNF31_02976 [Cafeteria roenbergensis]